MKKNLLTIFLAISSVMALAQSPYLFKDINPGLSSSSPSLFINVNGTLFFKASNGTNSFEL